MEREAMMSWWVDELDRQLESAHYESQDRVTEASRARVVELLAVEQATTVERGLDVVKVHLAKTKAALLKSLDALEMERKARSEVV